MTYYPINNEVNTSLPETAWNVNSVTNSNAASVIATRTSAPAERNLRTISGALYAATPPVTIRRILFEFSKSIVSVFKLPIIQIVQFLVCLFLMWIKVKRCLS